MTEEEKRKLREKIFVITHEFVHLQVWEVALLHDIDLKQLHDMEPTELELEIIEKLYQRTNENV